jgi:holo-[acyl-carrier protein] synthase
MIYGIGIDIVPVAEIAASIEEDGAGFLNRVFTPNEIQYCDDASIRYQRYAARFAAKEAAMKALSTGWDVGVEPQDFEVLNEQSGQPVLLVHGEAERLLENLGVTKKWVSLAHGPDYAIAHVIFEQ